MTQKSQDNAAAISREVVTTALQFEPWGNAGPRAWCRGPGEIPIAPPPHPTLLLYSQSQTLDVSLCILLLRLPP